MQRRCAKLLRAMLMAALLSVTVSAAAVAGPLEDANAAHEKGDDATALRLTRAEAEHGSADAQYNLGVIYFTGQGVPRDDTEAAKWFRLAADQGDATAQYNLGALYFSGSGVPQNYGEAAKLYDLAAANTSLHCSSQVPLSIAARDVYGLSFAATPGNRYGFRRAA